MERRRIKMLEHSVGVGFAGHPIYSGFVKLFVITLSSRIARATVDDTPTSSYWNKVEVLE